MILVLFDTGPKEDKNDLFGRGVELKKLEEAIKNKDRLIVIYGPRRVGKTSLLHVFLNEKQMPYALIDIRSLYIENGYISTQTLCRSIMDGFMVFLRNLGLETEKPAGIDEYESIPEALKRINQWCGERKVMFAIAFDEAQYLRFSGRAKYDVLIAWSVDNLPNISFVLTGSEVGMLKEFIRYGDVEAPLYGRFRDEIMVGRFDSAASKAFLAKGFKEAGVEPGSEEIDEVVASIDGIAGWLTYYGNYRTARSGMAQGASLQRVYAEGSKIALAELERLIAKSRSRYLYILKAIANGIDSWAEIRDYVKVKAGKISDARFSGLLESLIKFGFVEKEGPAYSLPDPLLMRAAKELKP